VNHGVPIEIVKGEEKKTQIAGWLKDVSTTLENWID